MEGVFESEEFCEAGYAFFSWGKGGLFRLWGMGRYVLAGGGSSMIVEKQFGVIERQSGIIILDWRCCTGG